MLIPTTLFVLLIISLIYKYLVTGNSRKWPPGPIWIPFVGSALFFKRRHIREYFYELTLSHGKLFQVQLLDTNIVVLNSVEIVNKAFATDGKHFNHRPSLFVANRLGLLDSISFLDINAKYKACKKIFMKDMVMYGSGYTNFETEFEEELQRVAMAIGENMETGFEVVKLLQMSTMNVIFILLTGTKPAEEDIQQISDLTSGEDFFLNAFNETLLSNVPHLVNLPYYKKRLEKVLKAKELLQGSILNTLQKSGTLTSKLGLVQGLILDKELNFEGSDFSSEDTVKAIIITDVLSAGFLTTASILPCVILCLVNHPEYQTQLQGELDRIIGQNRQPSIDDRNECHFTEAIIKETMRYITPNPFWLPHSCKRDMEFEGYHIKANSRIVANTWYIHHDENIWGDPWSFRPHRFLDTDGKILSNNHIYMKSFIPFGVGRRRCPGMEFASTRLFLYISTIFQKFTLMPIPEKCGSCDPRSEDFVFDLLLKPKPFYCRARRIGMKNII